MRSFPKLFASCHRFFLVPARPVSSQRTVRTYSSAFPQWALAARIVFAISPNSASCERVFSLLKLMFGEDQITTLADAIRACGTHAPLQRPHGRVESV